MDEFKEVRVREILERPYFRNAEVIAGARALDRLVKWVHIMEVTKVGRLLNGGELILSTGIGWQEEEDVGVAFLRQLIDSNAAGLCLELGTYTKITPERMKELAIRSDFPLILFHEEVRYVDITRDLHTFFVNRQHRMIADLDALTNQLNRLLLSGKGVPPLLRLLHEKTRRRVAFVPMIGEPIAFPASGKPTARAEAGDFANEHPSGKTKRRAQRPILVFQQKYAELVMEADEELGEFDVLALDRCATAAAQEMMRTMHVEERRRVQENVWIRDWLEGKLPIEEVAEHVGALKPGATATSATACVFEIERKAAHASDFESAFIQSIIAARSVFDSLGCLLAPARIGQHLAFVLLHARPKAPSGDALLQAVERLRLNERTSSVPMFQGLFGIGPAAADFAEVKRSYEAACETIRLQRKIGPLRRPLYAELHVYRIVAGMERTGELAAFVDEYIGPLLRYEQQRSAHLVKTLKTYLRLSGAKQETADALFIVRQTLYHRLSKIAELLGDDYLAPEKRMMIELALYGYEYMHGPVS